MIIFFLLNLLKSSTALTWTFPENYTTKTYWVFLFNLDVWEFAKVASGDYIAQVCYHCIVGDICWRHKMAIDFWSFGDLNGERRRQKEFEMFDQHCW